jgi:hypothetical protein
LIAPKRRSQCWNELPCSVVYFILNWTSVHKSTPTWSMLT